MGVSMEGYYSMSRLRTFYKDGCSYRFYLKYQRGFKEKISSSAFKGSIAHKMIQLAYHGIPLPDAHRRVWKQACPEIFQELQRWYQFDGAYQASGNPRTKARQLWTEQHPQHAELAQEIEGYKEEFLSQEYTWAKSAQLTEYYRWSAQLAILQPTQVLVPSAQLVEGLSLWDEEGHRIFARDTPEDVYRQLFGEIDGLAVGGVPDVFAVDGQGIAWVADYKTMSPMALADLAQDEQLALYVELLRQNGYIVPGQKVCVGHIYLTDAITEDNGVVQLWTALSPRTLPRLSRQLAYMERHRNDCIPIKGIATGARTPCVSCGLAAVCATTLAEQEE